MCKNIKQNTTNLRGKIGELIDAIEGEIITIEKRPDGGSYKESRSNGRTIFQTDIGISIVTNKASYFMGITWEVANNFSKDEVGIRSIGLAQENPITRLAVISATNGIENWHD